MFDRLTWRYFGIVTILGGMFMSFVACGSSMYQVNLHEDYKDENVSDAAKDPSNVAYGIHAPEGWTELPIRYVFGEDLNDLQKEAIGKAITMWETAIGKKIFTYQGIQKGTTGDRFVDLYSSLTDGINGDYLDYNWAKTGKSTGVLATTIWENSGTGTDKISTADIRFNAANYLLGDTLTGVRADDKEIVDMQSLATHELGHFLGLAHIDSKVDSLSIMNPTLFIGEGLTARKLSRDDIKRIQSIYGCAGTACDIDATFTKLESAADAQIASESASSMSAKSQQARLSGNENEENSEPNIETELTH